MLLYIFKKWKKPVRGIPRSGQFKEVRDRDDLKNLVKYFLYNA